MTVRGGVKAGKISKPYGLQGDVHIILIPALAQELKSGNPLFIDLDGQRVPFFMETVDLVSDDQAIVKVEFINSVEEARKGAGSDVYLDIKEASDTVDHTREPLEMIGYRVFDLRLGEVGKLTELIPSEMNPVWVIESAGRDIMIPATTDFIQKVDHKNKVLYLDLPEGIMEL